MRSVEGISAVHAGEEVKVHLDAPGGQILEPALVDGGTGAALPPGGGHHGGGPIGRAVIAALWLGQEPQPLDQRLGLDMRLGLGSVLPFPVGLFPRGPVLGGGMAFSPCQHWPRQSALGWSPVGSGPAPPRSGRRGWGGRRGRRCRFRSANSARTYGLQLWRCQL